MPEGEIAGHQWRTLRDWAEQCGFVVPDTLKPEFEGGREHDLLFSDGQWLKFTKPFSAGYVVEIVEGEVLMLPATPLQYLRRWKTSNLYFGDTVELVGIGSAQGVLRLVVSQPDVIGEAPSWHVLHRAFTIHLGFRQLRIPGKLLGGYESRAYFRGRIGVFDVRPLNCVITANGVVVPIDVITQTFNRDDSNVLLSLTVGNELS